MEQARTRRPETARTGVRIAGFAAPLMVLSYLALGDGGITLETNQTAALVIWAVVALATLFGTFPRAEVHRSLAAPLVALGVLVVWTAIGFAWTRSPELALEHLNRLLLIAGAVAMTVGLASRRDWRFALAGIATALIGVCVIALLARILPGVLPGDPGVSVGRRLAYPIEYWNALGAWAVMGTAMAWSWGLHARSSALRAMAFAGLPICVAVVYLTYSRGAAATLAVVLAALVASSFRSAGRWRLGPVVPRAAAGGVGSGLLILVIRSQPQIADGSGTDGAFLVLLAASVAAALCALAGASSRRSYRRVGADSRRPSEGTPVEISRPALAALALGVAGIVVATGLSGGASPDAPGSDPRFRSDPGLRLVSLEDNRTEYWASALSAWASEPLNGIDPGAFEFWWTGEGEGAPVRNAHSAYLGTLAEQGPIGLGALVLFLLGALAVGRSVLTEVPLADRGLMRGALASGFAFVVLLSIDWHWEVGAVAAAGSALLVIPATSRARPLPRRTILTRARLALVGVAIVAVLAQIPGLVVADRVSKAQDALAAGLLGTAQDNATDAVDAHPLSADARAIRAEIYLAGGRLGLARDDLTEALDLEPRDWRLYALLARLEATAGRDGAARAALSGLSSRNPALEPLVGQLADNLEGLRFGR